jgi:hypothetical protein
MILLRAPDCPPKRAQHPHVLQYIPVFLRCLTATEGCSRQIIKTFLGRQGIVIFFVAMLTLDARFQSAFYRRHHIRKSNSLWNYDFVHDQMINIEMRESFVFATAAPETGWADVAARGYRAAWYRDTRCGKRHDPATPARPVPENHRRPSA